MTALPLLALLCVRALDGAQAGGAVSPPTFARDVAPLVRARCATCHHADGPAPFALTSYNDVASRARVIARVVETGFMPPWLPEQGGETFVGARRLTAVERNTLLRWIEYGTPQGNPGAADAAPALAGTGANLEDGAATPENHLYLAVDEPYTVPAEGADVFRNFVLRVPLERTRYVRAVTIDPGAARVVHHASLGVDATRTARRLDAMDGAAGFEGMLAGAAQSPPGHLIGWAPGKGAQVSPPGLSWRLDSGSDLILQVHMVPSGKPEVVRPAVALSFIDKPPDRRAILVRIGSTDIDIPAGARTHELKDTFELPVDVEVLAVSPHAHYRARQIEAVATLPHGGKVPLLTIKRWDFRWQDDYRYVVPRTLPAGTRITTRVVYDNSTENMVNPQLPPQRATYGPGTSDEMGDVWFQVVPRSSVDTARLAQVLAKREVEAQSAGYRRLVSAKPTDPMAGLTLATLHVQSGRLREATQELDRVLSLAPSLTMALYTRGVALERSGDLGAAARDLRAALERDPRYAEAEHALGHVRLKEQNRREAEGHFVRAVTWWPEFADAWNSLGTLRASNGAIDAAIDAFRRALDAAPEHREALNNLAIVLARRGLVAEAISLLERALTAYPDDQASRQNLSAARALRK